MDETIRTDKGTVTAPRAEHEPENDGTHDHFVTDEEAWAIFDGSARYYMGISGEEFLRRWDAGEWSEEESDRVPVVHVVSMLPFAR